MITRRLPHVRRTRQTTQKTLNRSSQAEMRLPYQVP
jgi:hypothetical protein